MPTTFTSRKLVRDELVSKFTANDAWQKVYGYHPGVAEIKNRTPFLVIRSAGTEQQMANEWTNKATYRFALISYVLAYSLNSADNWSSDNAEDKLDALDAALRQVIRDNAGSMTTCDLLALDTGVSQVQDVLLAESLPYIRESRVVSAYLVNGA